MRSSRTAGVVWCKIIHAELAVVRHGVGAVLCTRGYRCCADVTTAFLWWSLVRH